MSIEHSIAIIVVTALCTLATRVAPFLLFGRKKEVPQTVKYLGKVLPPAIMAILVVYCFKEVDLFTGFHGLPEFLAAGVVIVLHLWRKNVLLSIGCGTFCYMLLLQIMGS